jgi:hypothetical protein
VESFDDPELALLDMWERWVLEEIPGDAAWAECNSRVCFACPVLAFFLVIRISMTIFSSEISRGYNCVPVVLYHSMLLIKTLRARPIQFGLVLGTT